MRPATFIDDRLFAQGFVRLERQAILDLRSEGFPQSRTALARSVAMRYAGQSFEIEVPWGKRFLSAFHAAHRARYGYADSSRSTEIVSLRLRATGITDKPSTRRVPSKTRRRPKAENIARVYLKDRPADIPVYARDQLEAGAVIRGPAVVTEYSSTTLIPDGRRVSVDAFLNLIIE